MRAKCEPILYVVVLVVLSLKNFKQFEAGSRLIFRICLYHYAHVISHIKKRGLSGTHNVCS